MRKYSELIRLKTFEDRYHYLRLRGRVGEETFGFDRPLNQGFYRSKQWKDIRAHVIARDNGCDLGIADRPIADKILVHHMNPLTEKELVGGAEEVLDPEYLISVSMLTHNAIHFGDDKLLIKDPVERKPGDTKLW